jgi:DNA excision repair protein ERCC-4
MSVHYKTPVLLIEFEEDKAFSLDVSLRFCDALPLLSRHPQVVTDMKSYAKPTNKGSPKKKPGAASESDYSITIQSKIALLVLTFPRVRIIWSSSPYATAEIFNDLKKNNAEPNPTLAITVGADGDPELGAGVNAAAEELLRCLPGINAKNVKHVMGKINSVMEFCQMDISQVQDILGVEPGRLCWEFMHRGEKR